MGYDGTIVICKLSYLSRICSAKMLTQVLPNLFHKSIIWQFVKHFLSVVNFALCITYTYWPLADAQVKKDKNLENQNVTLGPCNISLHFWLL